MQDGGRVVEFSETRTKAAFRSGMDDGTKNLIGNGEGKWLDG